MRRIRLSKRWVALLAAATVTATLFGFLHWHENRPATQAKRLVAMLRCQPPGFVEKWMVKLKLAQPEDQLQECDIQDRLVALGPDAFPAVVGLLEEGDRDLAGTGIAILARLRDPRAVNPLIAALDRTYLYMGISPPIVSMGVNDDAAMALGTLGDAQAVEPLLSYVRKRLEAGPRTQDALVWALGNLHDARAIPFFLDQAHRQVAHGQNVAVLALGQLRKDGVNALIQLLDDGDPSIVCNAVMALRDSGDTRAVGPLIDLVYAEPDFAEHLNRPTAYWMASDYRGPGPTMARDVRNQAIRALVAFDDSRKLDLFERLLREPTRRRYDDEYSKGEDGLVAIECLAAVGDPRGKLIDLAGGQGLGTSQRDDEIQRVSASADLRPPAPFDPQIEAIRALGLMGDWRAIRPLRAIIDRAVAGLDEGEIVAEAGLALGEIGDEGSVDCLSKLMKKRPWVAAMALAMIGTPEAIEHVRSLRDDDKAEPAVRGWATDVLMCVEDARDPVRATAPWPNAFGLGSWKVAIRWLPWIRKGERNTTDNRWPPPETMTLQAAQRDVFNVNEPVGPAAARWLVENGQIEAVTKIVTAPMWETGANPSLPFWQGPDAAKSKLVVAISDFGDGRFVVPLWQAYRRACSEGKVSDALRAAIITARLRLQQESRISASKPSSESASASGRRPSGLPVRRRLRPVRQLANRSTWTSRRSVSLPSGGNCDSL